MSRVFTCVAVRLVPTAVHVENATPIRGRGVPYDMKSPGLHEVGAVESEKETEAMVSFPCP